MGAERKLPSQVHMVLKHQKCVDSFFHCLKVGKNKYINKYINNAAKVVRKF